MLFTELEVIAVETKSCVSREDDEIVHLAYTSLRLDHSMLPSSGHDSGSFTYLPDSGACASWQLLVSSAPKYSQVIRRPLYSSIALRAEAEATLGRTSARQLCIAAGAGKSLSWSRMLFKELEVIAVQTRSFVSVEDDEIVHLA